ncbi:SLAM family member 5-like [Hippoglossus hippoglossus]|uniref:SLAM family member 5-like n=1 Tax=Hippoglossus hippoglossus TaxID=8267 RepID=UPI00148CE6A6|nr:SLAM family member 5-like [Hippoglossus hippoglossus]
MDGHSSSGPVTVLLLAALTSSALGQSKPFYFEDGKQLVLTPPEHGSVISSVVWTHNSNLVVEWVNKDLEFFGSFKGRTSLDESTAQLTVSAARQSDGGEYRVEINNVQQSQVYTAIVIKKVPKPSVVVVPTSCSTNSSRCTLTCQGDPAGTEPLTYSWRKDSGWWGPEQQSMDHLIINDVKTKRVEEISCRMKNPVSEEESDPLKNPMYRKGYVSPGELAAIICSSILAVVLVGLGLLIDP